MTFHSRTARTIGFVSCLSLVSGPPASWAQTSGANQVIPANATVLEGQPSIRLDVTENKATRHRLDSTEAANERLRITVVDGLYYWTSHDNRPLTLSTSGEFTYLSSTEPGRYIRFRKINDKISYVEHVEGNVGSVTYWGELRIVVGK
jgi:hypothetical protein